MAPYTLSLTETAFTLYTTDFKFAIPFGNFSSWLYNFCHMPFPVSVSWSCGLPSPIFSNLAAPLRKFPFSVLATPNEARKKAPSCEGTFGAGYEARTRYLHLGKVALYQMS